MGEGRFEREVLAVEAPAMTKEGEPTGETVSGHVVMTGLILMLVVPVLLFGIYWSPLMGAVESSLKFVTQGM